MTLCAVPSVGAASWGAEREVPELSRDCVVAAAVVLVRMLGTRVGGDVVKTRGTAPSAGVKVAANVGRWRSRCRCKQPSVGRRRARSDDA